MPNISGLPGYFDDRDAEYAAKHGTCKKRIFSGGRCDTGGDMCLRKATKDGWCALHHPDAEAERENKLRAKWKAESDAQEAAWARQAEVQRKARAYDAAMEYMSQAKLTLPFAVELKRTLEETK